MDSVTKAVHKVHPFWQERLRGMIMEVTTTRDRSSEIEAVRVAKDWPRRGSVMFTRSVDGQRFRAYLSGKVFRVVAV